MITKKTNQQPIKNIKNLTNKQTKKGQTNQIFVYIFSIIIILFVGFLVSKFLFTFFDDTDKILENKFYDKFETDYGKVYSVYGSESVNKYKVTSQVKLVCFISEFDCIDQLPSEKISDSLKEDLKTLVSNAKDNIIMFGNDGVLNSRKIGEFTFHNIDENENDNQCLCLTPNQGYFSLIFENKNNKVHIYQE